MDLNESTIVTNAIASGVTYGSGGGIESIADTTTTRLHNTLVAYNMNPGPPEGNQIKDCHTGSSPSNVFQGRFSLINTLNGSILDVSESMQLRGSVSRHWCVRISWGCYPNSSPQLQVAWPSTPGIPTSCPASDQRGYYRPWMDAVPGAVCDIGAFEYGSTCWIFSAADHEMSMF